MKNIHQELKLFLFGSGFTLIVIVVFTLTVHVFVSRSRAQFMMSTMSPECTILSQELSKQTHLTAPEVMAIFQEKGCMGGMMTAPTSEPTYSAPSQKIWPTQTESAKKKIPSLFSQPIEEEQEPSEVDEAAHEAAEEDAKKTAFKQAFAKIFTKYHKQIEDLNKLKKNKKKFKSAADKFYKTLVQICSLENFLYVDGTCLEEGEFKTIYTSSKKNPEKIIGLFKIVLEDMEGSLGLK